MNRRDFLKRSTAGVSSVPLWNKTSRADKGEDQSEAIVIVAGSRSSAEIMVGRDAGQVIHNAAQTLQTEIKRRTGVEVPIRNEADRQSGTMTILLGTLDRNASLT